MDSSDEEIPDLVFIDENDSELAPVQMTSEPAATTAAVPQPKEDVTDKSKTSVVKRQVVPLTILTGWLGSGKTTLLHNLLDQVSSQGKTIAILQNETSELMGVERALRLQDDSGIFGEMLEVKNGCVCCSVKSDFLLAIDTLLSRRHFDHVVVECSGVADVGSLATRLWVDDDLQSKVFLDGIVCLVDAQHVYTHMGWSRPTLDGDNHAAATDNVVASQVAANDAAAAHRGARHARVLMSQLVYADRILVNKCDALGTAADTTSAVDSTGVSHGSSSFTSSPVTFAPALPPTTLSSRTHRALAHLYRQLRAVNALAPVVATVHSRVPLPWVLGLRSLRLGGHSVGAVALPTSEGEGGAKGELQAGVSTLSHAPAATHTHMHLPSAAEVSARAPVATDAVLGGDLSMCAGTVSGVSVYTRDPGLVHQVHALARAEAQTKAKATSAGKEEGHGAREQCCHAAGGSVCAHGHGAEACHPMDVSHSLTHAHAQADDVTLLQTPITDDVVTNAHGIGTVVLRLGACVSLQRLKQWLVRLSWEGEQDRSVAAWQELRERQRRGEVAVDDRDEAEGEAEDAMYIYRMKGVFAVQGVDEKYYLQGVLETFDLAPADQTVGIDVSAKDEASLDTDGVRLKQDARVRNPQDMWQEGEERHSAVIFIGYNLNIKTLVEGFANCSSNE